MFLDPLRENQILPAAQDSTKPPGGLLCIVASQPCEVNSKRCVATTDFTILDLPYAK
jgi:hypothetical protein